MAADLFLQKFQMPQKYGRNGAKRPFGPAGKPCVQHCSATCGASRLATAQALGGFMISAPLPETSHLLFEASSQAGASGGRNGGKLLVVLERLADVVGLDRDVALGVDELGAEGLEDRAGGVDRVGGRAEPDAERRSRALWQASAALRKVSSVQLSALGALPAGYIACTSMPACCFIRSMREHGPLIWLPTVAGTASHWPLSLAEILDRAVDGAVLLDQLRP